MTSKRTSTESTHLQDKRVLIYGCGYLGREIGRQLLLSHSEVWGTARSRESCKKIRNIGISPILSDWSDRRTLSNLDAFTHIVIAVSRGREEKRSHWESLVIGLKTLLPYISAAENVVYISSTGVYHQRDGLWVDENSPTFPNRPSTRAHLAAEDLLRRNRPNQPWNILRLAGIYGPNRVPNCQNVLNNTPIKTSPNSYLNLIHVEDAAQAVTAAIEKADQSKYVVSDDRPTKRADYYSFIAQYLKASPPTFININDPSTNHSRAEGNKRVWNRKMKNTLLPKLKYPTFEQGLPNLLKPFVTPSSAANTR